MLKRIRRFHNQAACLLKWHKCYKWLFLYYFLYIVIFLLTIFVSNVEKNYVDKILLSQNHNSLFEVVSLYFLGQLIICFTNYSATVYKEKMRIYTNNAAKGTLVECVLKKPLAYMKEINIDDLKTRVEVDANVLSDGYLSLLTICIPALVMIVALSALMFSINIWLSIILIACAVLSSLSELYISRKIDKANLVVREKSIILNNTMYEQLRDYVAIKCRNMQSQKLGEFINCQNALKKANRHWMLSHTCLIVAGIIKTDFLQKALIYFSSGVGVVSGAVSIGSAILLLNYFTTYCRNLSTLIESVVSFRSNVNSFRKCLELTVDQADSPKQTVVATKEITINDLVFAYNDSLPILQNINLNLKAGDKVVIFGGSGQGKSTFLKCLAQIERPVTGQIQINDINISQIANFYDLVNISMQDAKLFNLSIWDNLTLGNSSLSRDDVRRVCSDVGLLHDIEKMEFGFDSRIGPGGIQLSGGQQQKIIFARSLLRNTECLFFDETNSALDEESEDFVNRILLQLEEKTVVIISHRRNTIDKYHHRYYLSNGELHNDC